MTRRFVAIGECMVEFAPSSDGTYTLGFAGDTFNTAWYVRQLAAQEKLEVTYVSAVGDDELSLQLTRFVEGAGITPAFATIEGASPGVYMIFLEEGERSFQYWRSHSAARQLVQGLGALEGVGPGDIIYFSGITVAILDAPSRAILLGALSNAADQGADIVFDPNLRPRLWQSACEMCSWTTKAAQVADLVLPSFDDEAAHFGDLDPVETAQRYLRGGARLVVVKNGKGALMVRASDGDEFQFHPELVANVVDTTAAGDSFNAAFLTEYSERGRARAAVRAGCSLAAHVIGSRGALVPVSQLDLIARRNRLSA